MYSYILNVDLCFSYTMTTSHTGDLQYMLCRKSAILITTILIKVMKLSLTRHALDLLLCNHLFISLLACLDLVCQQAAHRLFSASKQ